MEEIHNILGYETSLKIIQKKDSFNFSIDSTILSFFAKPNYRCESIIDLGSGTGAIPLFMSILSKAKKIYGVEIQKDIYDMSLRSVKLNNLEDRITIINDDINGISKKFNTSSFDLVTSNPPYFKLNEKSLINESDYLSIARHELKITMEDIIKEARTLLKDNGSLIMIQRCDRFQETLSLLNKYNFSLKRLRFVYPKPNKDSHIFMFDARKKGGETGLKILEPLYIYKENDEYSDEILEYFHYGEEDEKK
ncbi:MAG: tRNA1(Val) (adenine(37)-N6)-methyltransferase [Gammaproteobacteria bacterium]|nr:tRNA1(Val) (adenine(37)-N6)-methyltransferase [Gammaproteobacteria bacterium]